MAAWIKMLLCMELRLGPGNFALDGEAKFWPLTLTFNPNLNRNL